MKILCKQTTSEGFDLKEVTTIFSNDHDYNVGGYGIELGAEYIVMGIALYKDSNCLYYLIDVNGRPDWYPFLLFDVLDNTLPLDWSTRITGKKDNSDIYALWGFSELCNDPYFYDKLLERDDKAMKTYFMRKTELEEESNND